jgi:hypothetical protein
MLNASHGQLAHSVPKTQLSRKRARLEALTRVIELQGEKLSNLAKDIVDNGLSPIDRLLVIEDEALPDHYVVVEGNRRATALIILNNPALASPQIRRLK